MRSPDARIWVQVEPEGGSVDDSWEGSAPLRRRRPALRHRRPAADASLGEEHAGQGGRRAAPSARALGAERPFHAGFSQPWRSDDETTEARRR